MRRSSPLALPGPAVVPRLAALAATAVLATCFLRTPVQDRPRCRPAVDIAGTADTTASDPAVAAIVILATCVLCIPAQHGPCCRPPVSVVAAAGVIIFAVRFTVLLLVRPAPDAPDDDDDGAGAVEGCLALAF